MMYVTRGVTETKPRIKLGYITAPKQDLPLCLPSFSLPRLITVWKGHIWLINPEKGEGFNPSFPFLNQGLWPWFQDYALFQILGHKHINPNPTQRTHRDLHHQDTNRPALPVCIISMPPSYCKDTNMAEMVGELEQLPIIKLNIFLHWLRSMKATWFWNVHISNRCSV